MSALELEGLSAGYGALQVLKDIDLCVQPGEILTVLGRNGAGRSTLLKAIMGLVSSQGRVRVQGRELEAHPTHVRATAGLAYVPETRDIFPNLSVDQNLQLGMRRRGTVGVPANAWTLERLRARFPILSTRRRTPAGALSGGEQQMLALGRSLLLQPQVLLVDEPTEGLSPAMIRQVQALLAEVAATGCAIVLVEQKLSLALEISSRCIVLGRGAIVYEGTPRELVENHPVARDWLEI